MKQVITVLLLMICIFAAGIANDIRIANPVTPAIAIYTKELVQIQAL
jgi:uncharacterized membrane protein YiaA